MIALVKRRRRRQSQSTLHAKFLPMLPRIRSQASSAFRNVPSDMREELITEVVANAYCAYCRLVERGMGDVAFAGPLGRFAIRQVCSGRQVGGRLSARDIQSLSVQRSTGIVIERLERFDGRQGEWREVLVEDRRAGPAETAAARIDMAAWLASLGRRKRRIAQTLARGETTSKAATMFGVTAARISQLREELRQSWHTFQSEPCCA